MMRKDRVQILLLPSKLRNQTSEYKYSYFQERYDLDRLSTITPSTITPTSKKVLISTD